MAAMEGLDKGFEIDLKEFDNDYEQLCSNSGHETTYSTYTKQYEEEANHFNKDICTPKRDYETVSRKSVEETPYSTFTKPDEENTKGDIIEIDKPKNDYEKVRRKSGEGTTYSTYSKQGEKDINTEIGIQGFDNNSRAPAMNSLEPLVPLQSSCNRKKTGVIAAISVGLITIISISVVVVITNGTDNNVLPSKTLPTATRPVTSTATTPSNVSLTTISNVASTTPVLPSKTTLTTTRSVTSTARTPSNSSTTTISNVASTTPVLTSEKSTTTTRPVTSTATTPSTSSTTTISNVASTTPVLPSKTTSTTTRPVTSTSTTPSNSSTTTISNVASTTPVLPSKTPPTTTRPVTSTATTPSNSSTTTISNVASTTPVLRSETTPTTTRPVTSTATTPPNSSTTTISNVASTTPGNNSYQWSLWGEWTQCTATCDTGFHTRYRHCNEERSSLCLGDYVETELCAETNCNAVGKWTTWSSWGSCDVTCGGGSHVRNRNCIKSDEFDKDCTGQTFQQKTCSNWSCPDCNQECTNGVLNDRCDTCICDNNYITGRILARATGNPVIGAGLYSRTAPTRLLTLSNSSGFFSLNTTCTESELYITKEGFIDSVWTVNDTFIVINLERIVKPFLKETPQSKYRLSDENVTFCCKASANPEIRYYEWFKNNIIIDKKIDRDETQLSLTFLNRLDSGLYQCRANSDAGAIMSSVAVLTVRDEPSEFCSDALKQKKILLPDECMQPGSGTSEIDVGECLTKKCRAKDTTASGTCEDEVDSCCSVKEYRVETINCTDYELDVVVVKSCGCALCTSSEVTISGVVTGLEKGTPARFASVYLNGELKDSTTITGSFEFRVSSSRSRWTLTIEDDAYNNYLPASKVIEVFDDSTGIIYVEIKMIEASDPVQIDSAIDNTLSAGSSSDSNVSNVLFEVPANAFCYTNGSKYSGTVNARLTYLDPLDTSIIEHIPGLFQYVDDEGLTKDLVSSGVFNLYFEDTAGKSVVLNQVVNAYIPIQKGENVTTYDNFQLWALNSDTGIWETEEEDAGKNRQMRQADDLWIGALADVSRQKWYNSDKVKKLSKNQCFFKIRLFKDENMEIPIDYPSNVITVRVNIIRERTLHTIKHYISDPTRKCLNVPCDGDKSYITGKTNTQFLSSESPYPSSGLSFSISLDKRVLTVQLKQTGPFHSSEDKCLSASIDKSYLSFTYGIKNYEWKFIDDPKKCNKTVFETDRSIRQRYWYPYSIKDKFSVCFVRIKIHFKPGRNVHKNRMKLRVFSYGGHEGKILGIHESDVKDSQTYCLEYRCSGYIDPCTDETFDKTRVRIILEYPNSILKCFVEKSAVQLENEQSYYNRYSDYTHFQFSATHKELGTNAGFFNRFNVGTAAEIETKKKELIGFCEDQNQNVMTELGYVVSFYCE